MSVPRSSTGRRCARRSTVGVARVLAGGVAALALALTGCTSGGDPESSAAPDGGHEHSTGASAPSSPGTSSPGTDESPADDANQVVIDITLSDGDQVDPNGEKVDVEQGQTVVLNVTSDRDDEIHVHGDIEVAVPVAANDTASKSFVAEAVGSFEVESHHPNKIIAILNVR